MANDTEFKVATQCMTYNHAAYIEQTLKGFAIQQTAFPVVYVVVDDASTDGEPDVLRKWAAQNLADANAVGKPYGDLFFARHKDNANAYFAILLLAENHYQTGRDKLKYEYIAQWCSKAAYIALCEGDDCWINPNKLSMQVEYMDRFQDCVMTHTAFRYSKEGHFTANDAAEGTKFNLRALEQGADIRPYILDGNRYLIQTLTVLMRAQAYFKAMKEMQQYDGMFLMSDTILWMTLLQYGRFHFFWQETAVYRLHADSATNQKSVARKVRFLLSCAEMRITMAQKYDMPLALKRKLYKQYNRMLTKYLWIDRDYKPFVEVRYRNVLERMFYGLLRTRMAGALGKKILH